MALTSGAQLGRHKLMERVGLEGWARSTSRKIQISIAHVAIKVLPGRTHYAPAKLGSKR
jgi:hypothetical protein